MTDQPAPAGLSRAASAALAAALLAMALAGCEAVPRSGPLAAQIDAAGSGGASGDPSGAPEGLVAALTPELAARVSRATPQGVPDAFRDAAPVDPERLGVGDVIDVAIWESGEAGLFGENPAAGAARLEAVRVEPGGVVHLPFAGVVRAGGATTAELRARIRDALAPLSLDPQVSVRLVEPLSRRLTVQGAVRNPGAYALETGALTLAPMLALAGGASLPPEQVEVLVRRGGREFRTMLEDVYDDAARDVALRPGDLVVLSPLRARFVALGATSAQAEIGFPTRELTLLSALGAARGLRDFDADPTGVFVFRHEPRALADAILPGPPPEGLPVGATRPVVYRLDLTAPGAIFTAQAFAMRDGDAIFATNAPLTELRKLLQLFTAVLTPIQQGAVIAP